MIKEMPLSLKKRSDLRTWIEVDTAALKHNYKVFRGAIKKDCRLMAVAKSNAYGHDLAQFAKTEEKFGIDWFGVDSITEAAALREAGIKKPISVLGHTLPERLNEASEKNISITLSSISGIGAIKKTRTAYPLKVHLKVDTGMHRQGFSVEELPRVLGEITKLNKTIPVPSSPRRVWHEATGLLCCPGCRLRRPHNHDSPSHLCDKTAEYSKSICNKKIIVEGLYTHFAAAKNPAFPAETMRQLDEFKKAAYLTYSAGFKPICHAAATSGTLLYPQSHFDMVRVGIGLYGLWPSKEARAAVGSKIKLKPALAWKTVVGEVKKIPKGSGVGYDFTEKMEKDSLIAICPVGYWHGIPRALSSIGSVLIKGRRSKILGRVSMDMIAVDVSAVPAPMVGDEVVLIGKSQKEEVSADKLAYLADTVNYEIVTRLNPLMKRFYV